MTESIFRSNTIYNPLWPGFWSTRFKGLTFSWKNEQWKWTVLPDIDSRCKSFLLSVLWTTTCSRNGIPTGLKSTWQRDGWNTLCTLNGHFYANQAFQKFQIVIIYCHNFLMNKNMRLNAITFRFITFHSKKDFVWYFFHCSSTHYILWKFKYLKIFDCIT